MGLKTQATLYFVAAGLFAIATALNLFNDGLGIKTVAGLVFAGVMLSLGLKARKEARADGLPPA